MSDLDIEVQEAHTTLALAERIRLANRKPGSVITRAIIDVSGDPSVGIPHGRIEISGLCITPENLEQYRKDLNDFFNSTEDMPTGVTFPEVEAIEELE